MHEKQYLINHKDFFIKHISCSLPWTPDLLKKHKDILNWDYLSRNHNLEWTTQLLEDFRDMWNWNCLSGNGSLPWSEELIMNFPDKWNFVASSDYLVGCILNNDSITWSKNLVYKFRDRINGVWLAQRTEILNNYPEILDDFKEKLWWEYISGNEYMNWSEKLIDQFIALWDWDVLSANEAVGWTSEMKEKYRDRFNNYYHEHHYLGMYANRRRRVEVDSHEEDKNPVILYTPEEFEKVRKSSPSGFMSLDAKVPWSDELIEKWAHEWNWDALSFNGDLPWSENLLERYSDKWNFGIVTNDPVYGELHVCGLSSNPALPWSLRLLKKYESKWDWDVLSSSENLPWSLEILEAFDHKWNLDRLIWNENMWNTVFQPFLDDEIIDSVLTLFKNEKGGLSCI